MRRMLDPKEAGGSLPSTIKFDTEGNRTVKKNLGVDGKLTLKSLVSASNPDGDITKELGGAKLYKHTIFAFSSTYGMVYFTLYNYSNVAIDSEEKIINALKSIGEVVATGYIKNGFVFNVYLAQIVPADGKAYVSGYHNDPNSGDISTTSLKLDYHFSSFRDDVKEVR